MQFATVGDQHISFPLTRRRTSPPAVPYLGLSRTPVEAVAVTEEEVNPSWGQSLPVRAEGIVVKPDSGRVKGKGPVRKE